MEDIHVNPVGIIRKDIYVIKNRINNKVYIGQSKDVKYRFYKHCTSKKSLISNEIKKYGKENFYYEILEHDIINYNEMESYWIKKMNCIYPNGYNINKDNLPHVYKGLNSPTSNLNEKSLNNIIICLKNTKKSLGLIAKQNNTNKKTVLRINKGISYKKEGIIYPIRKISNINGKLTTDDVTKIINILKKSYRNYDSIGIEFKVGARTIEKINLGYLHRMDNVSYPVRKNGNSGGNFIPYNDVSEIIDLIRYTKMSYREIARNYNICHNTVLLIKNGNASKYRREGLTYPLRKNN